MRRSLPLIAATLLAALPARAAELQRDEPLVMRIIFEDCLGYVRVGRTPFAGLPTRPATAAAVGRLPARMPDRDRAIELLSPRYTASWGEDANGRHCYVGSSYEADQAGLPGLLGAPVRGFLKRVTARATAEGLTQNGVADELSTLSTSYWSEPETGHDRGPGRPVSVSLMATTGPDASGIADAGLILMSGPTGGRR
ncbi:MAG: hypothetical protein E7K72_00860 [Roseomonas mucosa]|nr:hypothetical protein [Roseomonas mucosa]